MEARRESADQRKRSRKQADHARRQDQRTQQGRLERAKQQSERRQREKERRAPALPKPPKPPNPAKTPLAMRIEKCRLLQAQGLQIQRSATPNAVRKRERRQREKALHDPGEFAHEVHEVVLQQELQLANPRGSVAGESQSTRHALKRAFGQAVLQYASADALAPRSGSLELPVPEEDAAIALGQQELEDQGPPWRALYPQGMLEELSEGIDAEPGEAAGHAVHEVVLQQVLQQADYSHVEVHAVVLQHEQATETETEQSVVSLRVESEQSEQQSDWQASNDETTAALAFSGEKLSEQQSESPPRHALKRVLSPKDAAALKSPIGDDREEVKQETCPCCLDYMVDDQNVYTLNNCKHRHHTDCLLAHVGRGGWNEKGPRCTVCNRHIGQEDEDELDKLSIAAGEKASLAVPTAQSGQTSKQATEENEIENDKQLAAALEASVKMPDSRMKVPKGLFRAGHEVVLQHAEAGLRSSGALAKVPQEDPKVCAFGTYVHRSSVGALEPEQWLNTSLIDFLLRGLSLGSEQCVTMDTHVYSQLRSNQHETFDKQLRQFKNVKQEQPCYVLMPVHLGNHFTLAVFCNVNGKMPLEGTEIDAQSDMFILYLDSMNTQDQTVTATLQKAGRLIRQMCAIGAGTVQPLRPWGNKAAFDGVEFPLYSTRLAVPKQTNTWDCGMYTVENAAHFIHDPLRLIGIGKVKDPTHASQWETARELLPTLQRVPLGPDGQRQPTAQLPNCWFSGEQITTRRAALLEFFGKLEAGHNDNRWAKEQLDLAYDFSRSEPLGPTM